MLWQLRKSLCMEKIRTLKNRMVLVVTAVELSLTPTSARIKPLAHKIEKNPRLKRDPYCPL
jgi:hypothetical protein